MPPRLKKLNAAAFKKFLSAAFKEKQSAAFKSGTTKIVTCKKCEISENFDETIQPPQSLSRAALLKSLQQNTRACPKWILYWEMKRNSNSRVTCQQTQELNLRYLISWKLNGFPGNLLTASNHIPELLFKSNKGVTIVAPSVSFPMDAGTVDQSQLIKLLSKLTI